MAKDRLQDLLQETASGSGSSKIKATWNKASPSETVSLRPNFKMASITKSAKKEQESLEAIFKQVNMITVWIETMRKETVALQHCHTLIFNSTRPETGRRDEMQCLMANVRSLSGRTRGCLQDLKMRKENEGESGVGRVIQSQYLILSNNFSDALEEYRTTLDLYRKRNEDILKKQLLITDKEVTKEQLSVMLDAQDTAIFADDYLKDTWIARQQLIEARNRHAEILAIEKEIIEIRDLFSDLALQVSLQGELIDNVEYHVMKGVHRTQGGTHQLSKASKKQTRHRKSKIWVTACLVIVASVFLLAMLIQLGG